MFIYIFSTLDKVIKGYMRKTFKINYSTILKIFVLVNVQSMDTKK